MPQNLRLSMRPIMRPFEGIFKEIVKARPIIALIGCEHRNLTANGGILSTLCTKSNYTFTFTITAGSSAQ